MAKLIQPPTDGERDDSAPAAPQALHSLGAMEGQESSPVGRAGSSGGRSDSSGPHLQQVSRETSSVTPSCAPTLLFVLTTS